MNQKTMMEKIINTGYTNIAGLVVKKHGETVYESYYNDCTAKNKIHICSATKSIISALYGIAYDRGLITDLDKKVLEYFDEFIPSKENRAVRDIAIRNMLTMTTPYRCKTEPYEKFFLSDNPAEVALDILGGSGKIGDFIYSPIVGTHILSVILNKVIDQPFLEFAKKNLFEPLGIRVAQNLILKTEQEHKDFMYSKNIDGWMVDPQGINVASMGLTLTSNDMANIGQLYLNKGTWNGKQIISSEWIEESTKVQSRCDPSFCKFSYGYLWWIIDEQEHSYAAIGDGGNVIYVNPSKAMVVSILSLYMPKAKDRIKLIQDYIEPVFSH